MNSNQEALDNLKYGDKPLDINDKLPTPSDGFNSKLGAEAVPVQFKEVSATFERLQNGELTLHHFSPEVAK